MLKIKPEIGTRNPVLFQVNTRVWLTEMSKKLGRQATLKDINDKWIDDLAEQGFAWVYFLSVWQTGEVGRNISRNNAAWVEGFRTDMPDLNEDDICGSGFAVTDYVLNSSFGTPNELANLHERLNERGINLMLDLVPNHTAVDHIWVKQHPDYYMPGSEEMMSHAPQNFIKVGQHLFAHGRDPYFDGWPDTLQLNYGNPEFQKAMKQQLEAIAVHCDGLRCDMAMLLLPDVFRNTWGMEMQPFWSDAIASIKKAHPGFVFMAEVYWDREWDLQQQGFDYTYDKKLYDRLRQGAARAIREHFWADKDYQRKSARFLENHDEPRAAGTFPWQQHKAAAVLTFLCPGLRFLHQGQFEGYSKRVSVHLCRRPTEGVNPETSTFYDSLLAVLKLPVVHNGSWNLLECREAWEGNWTWDCFIAFSWKDEEAGDHVIAVVNYSSNQAQCYIQPATGLNNNSKADSIIHGAVEIGPQITDRGVYVDLQPWGYSVFTLQTKQS